eukprot:1819031-Prymnesium_polylepis.3
MYEGVHLGPVISQLESSLFEKRTCQPSSTSVILSCSSGRWAQKEDGGLRGGRGATLEAIPRQRARLSSAERARHSNMSSRRSELTAGACTPH